MGDTWKKDVVALTDAYRQGSHDPISELEATLEAIDKSDLNAFSHVDAESAREAAANADLSLPLGGVPIGIKELDQVEGWPDTHASLAFADNVADHSSTMVKRLKAAGAVLVGLTTASEFGGLNVGATRLNGVTRNPWDPSATPGGSSTGSAAAVAGALVPIASGGDGGGSIRIPAAFCGLVGMKGTAGRIPRGPQTAIYPLTIVFGCLARSVRDVALWYDVCAGSDTRDPYSLPSDGQWATLLGSDALTGLKVAVLSDMGGATIHDSLRTNIESAGAELIDALGATRVDLDVSLPAVDLEWAMANLVSLRVRLGDRWPDCGKDLTPAIALGMELAEQAYDINLAARVEKQRTDLNEKVAAIFDEVDVVLSATNPEGAFPAELEMNTRVAGEKVAPGNNGALTIPANIAGNPSCSVPVGTIDGKPVGMQIMARQHCDRLVLDLANRFEKLRPWPLHAPI